MDRQKRVCAASLICFCLAVAAVPLGLLTVDLLGLTGGDLNSAGAAIAILLLFALISGLLALAAFVVGIRIVRQRRIALWWLIPSAAWAIIVLLSFLGWFAD